MLATLKNLRDLGNTLIVVEHDEDTMRAADYIVDIGPGAGEHGGEVVAAGTVEDIMECARVAYRCISERQTDHSGAGAAKKSRPGLLPSAVLQENNLKNMDVKIPVGSHDLCDRSVRLRKKFSGQ